MRVCIRSINQSNHSIPVRCWLCFIRTFTIQSHTKIALLEIFQYRNSHDLYVLMYHSVQIRPFPHESERCKITQFCMQNNQGRKIVSPACLDKQDREISNFGFKQGRGFEGLGGTALYPDFRWVLRREFRQFWFRFRFLCCVILTTLSSLTILNLKRTSIFLPVTGKTILS